MMLDVYAEDDTGARTDLLVRVGGRWDRRTKEWVGEGRRRSLAVHPGQIAFFVWFVAWLGAYLAGELTEDEKRIYSALLGGGQRSGKTWVGVLACVIFAVAVPGSIVWIVSPTDGGHEEVEDLLRAIMPTSWYTSLGAPHWRYRLANGSKIVLRSGHKPEGLKKGDADFILINEAQQQAEKVFAICRARIAAAGGLCLIAANPPDQPQGQWVGDFASEAKEGLRQALYFPLNPLDNPHIDKGPLLAMRKEFDEHTFRQEVLGEFLGARNAVLHNWNRTENEAAPPEHAVDITAEVLKKLEGREFDRVVAVDVQKHPHMASAEFKFYEDPALRALPGRLEWPWMWAVSEFFLKGADEEALAIAWLEADWDPDRTLVICDASGAWQFAERDPTKLKDLREKVQGRGSFDVFRRMGFRHVVKPDRAMEKNPDILERVRATTSRICTAVPNERGQRFLFSHPRCRELNKSIRNWPTKGGQPMRGGQWAHGGDVVTYAVQRFFPRRTPHGSTEVKVIKRHEGAARMKGW